MKKRKADENSDGPVSAFAFKAKQVPLKDLSNSSPPNGPAAQVFEGHGGINGSSPKKSKLANTAPPPKAKAPSAKPSTSAVQAYHLGNDQGSHNVPKNPFTATITAGQVSIIKTSELDEGVWEDENSSNSGVGSPRAPAIRFLSTFKRTSENVKDKEDCSLFRMRQGDTLAVLGQYDIWVQKGAVSLMGATLHASSTAYRVYAPSTHALPTIRCVPDPFNSVAQETVVLILVCKSGIRLLKQLSPRFGRIWNDADTPCEEITTAAQFQSRSFSPMYDSAQDPLKRPLQPLVISASWRSLYTRFSAMPLPIVMVCGPKASGKSTFSRLTLNCLLSKSLQRRKQTNSTAKDEGVALLDLDPGQPEFSPPGELSLTYLRTFNFGPQFTHPVVDSKSGNRLLRAHHIAAISPRDDPDHYLACALDLMKHYRRLLHTNPTCPLVINCSGWILGSGLEILTELILKLAITDVVYMSDSGPPEVVNELKSATNRARVSLHTLPSQPSEFVTRSAADLRVMQTLSYFHLATPRGDHLSWDHKPITNITPWVVRYGGPNQGILGIMVLGERQDLECLVHLLDGTLVGVVAIEDNSAVPGQHQDCIGGKALVSLETPNDCDESPEQNKSRIYQFPDFSDNEDDLKAEGNDTPWLPPPSSPTDSQHLDEEIDPGTHSERSITDHPSVTRTPNEDLPYLFSGHGTCTPLDPQKSHSLGLALIRGIDKASKTLHLITPIPPSTIQALLKNKTKIVLVKGKLDTPAWAYQEEYCAAAAAEKRRMGTEDADSTAVGMEEGELSEGKARPRMWEGGVPWVRLLNGPEGRGRGERMWRVRRNLKVREMVSDDGMSD